MSSAANRDALIEGKVPDAGSILWCYFPEVKGAPVRHPCLVLASQQGDDGMTYVAVAAGQSVIKNGAARRTYPNELIFAPGHPDLHGKSLSDVKFSFEDTNVNVLPYCRRWFYIAEGQTWPKIGHIDLMSARTKDALTEILVRQNTKARIESLFATYVTASDLPAAAAPVQGVGAVVSGEASAP